MKRCSFFFCLSIIKMFGLYSGWKLQGLIDADRTRKLCLWRKFWQMSITKFCPFKCWFLILPAEHSELHWSGHICSLIYWYKCCHCLNYFVILGLRISHPCGQTFVNNCSERNDFIEKRLKHIVRGFCCCFFLSLFVFWPCFGFNPRRDRDLKYDASSPLCASDSILDPPCETSDTRSCRWGWWFFFHSCQIEDVLPGSQTDSLIAYNS